MNANELADKLDDIPINDFESLDQHHYTRQAATMLRQQQAEIEALKQIIDANNLIQNIGQFVKPQEKCPPISWWKGDPTCGGITENYGLGKTQEK
jgi:hypothetical protein